MRFVISTQLPSDNGYFGVVLVALPLNTVSGESGIGRGHEGEDHDEADANQTVVVTGPGGSAWTPGEGYTWFTLPDVTGYWASRSKARRSVGWSEPADAF